MGGQTPSEGRPTQDSQERVESFVVEESEGGRVDRSVAARLGLSRTRVQALIDAGALRVDGDVPRKSQELVGGERVEVRIPPPEPLRLEPEDVPLHILYQDSHVVVVDKPSGMVVHPSAGHARGTLVHALLHHVADLSGIGGALRPGIVHRLDRDTSGLLIVAKTDQAHQALSRALAERRIRRVYLAAAWGHLPSSPQTVDAPIGRHPRDRKRMTVVDGGRSARTTFAVDERWAAAELLRVTLETGRTHQIRVHLLHIGHPVVGDSTYGTGWERGMSGPNRQWAARLASRATRQFLHAHELVFRHPVTGQELRFVSPLPPDLAEVARWARGDAPGTERHSRD